MKGAPAAASGWTRLASIDALRGVVMLLLFGEALRSCEVANALATSAFWQFVCRQQSHAEWAGMHLHDLIQPGFTFLVGVSMPLSIARRRARADSHANLIRHALLRSLVLVLMGVAMVSVHRRTIVWSFTDTLTQIGLGYAFVFALALMDPKWWLRAFGLILVGVWLAFVLYPVAEPGYDYAARGVTPEWLQQYGFSGWRAHWQKNANAASAFDTRFLRLFPGNEGYVSANGLATLNFLPTMATMILGLWAGRVLTEVAPGARALRRLLFGAVAAAAVAFALDATGLCPVVKSVWTPSWVLLSGGIWLALLAIAHFVLDLQGRTRGTFVLTVVGRNSLVAYMLTHLYPAFAWGALRKPFGELPFAVFGTAYAPVVYGLAVMAMYWLVLYSLHRAGWYLRV